jgi:hypothetical protein
MKTTAEKAAEALELLPEDIRERAVGYLVEAGNVSEWNFDEFLREVREPK